MPGVPSPSSVDGLEIQKKETLAEIQKCKNNLAALNDTYAALSKKQQLARERECNSPTQNRDLLKELLKHPKRRTIGSCTNGKDRSKANREQSLSGDEVLEEFSKIRMVNVQIPPSEFHDRMKNRRFIKMDEIERSMVDGDIPGDFVIIGILVHQKVVQCEDTTVKALVLTDLHQNYLRLFLVERALEKQYEDGSLVAILNPQILMPSKRSALIGLVIDSSALFIKLGTSSDHGWCNASGKSCRIIVNTTREAYCTDHRMEMYHSARIQRQEFAGGLNPVQQGAPNDNIKKKQCNRVLGCVAHYNIRSLVLATDTLNCTLKEKPKPTSQQCTTQEL